MWYYFSIVCSIIFSGSFPFKTFKTTQSETETVNTTAIPRSWRSLGNHRTISSALEQPDYIRVVHCSNSPTLFLRFGYVWKCGIPPIIATFRRDNDQQNHWVYIGVHNIFRQTHMSCYTLWWTFCYGKIHHFSWEIPWTSTIFNGTGGWTHCIFLPTEVDKFVQKVLAETGADVEEVIIEKAASYESLNFWGLHR